LQSFTPTTVQSGSFADLCLRESQLTGQTSRLGKLYADAWAQQGRRGERYCRGAAVDLLDRELSALVGPARKPWDGVLGKPAALFEARLVIAGLLPVCAETCACRWDRRQRA